MLGSVSEKRATVALKSQFAHNKVKMLYIVAGNVPYRLQSNMDQHLKHCLNSGAMTLKTYISSQCLWVMPQNKSICHYGSKIRLWVWDLTMHVTLTPSISVLMALSKHIHWLISLSHSPRHHKGPRCCHRHSLSGPHWGSSLWIRGPLPPVHASEVASQHRAHCALSRI